MDNWSGAGSGLARVFRPFVLVGAQRVAEALYWSW